MSDESDQTTQADDFAEQFGMGHGDKALGAGGVANYRGRLKVKDVVYFVPMVLPIALEPKVAADIKAGSAGKIKVALSDANLILAEEHKIPEGSAQQVEVILRPSFFRRYTHYVKGLGYVQCMSTPQHQAACCKDGGEPRARYGTVIVQYYTTEEGEIVAVAGDEPFRFALKHFICADSTVNMFKGCVRSMSALKYDIQITCTSEEYQRLAFSIAGESALLKQPACFLKVLKACKSRFDSIRKRLARKMTEAEYLTMTGRGAQVKPAATEAAGGALLDGLLG